MPLVKQSINLPFGQGVDTKTDPFQVVAGKMLSLENVIFSKGGQLTKRNGFKQLTTLPNNLSTTATTFQGNLIAAGTTLNVLSESTSTWVDKGNIQPLSLSVEPIARTGTDILSSDTAIADNGLGCVVYYDSSNTSYYQIFDSQTGEIIVGAQAISAETLSPRVFVLGKYFMVVGIVVTGGTHTLSYIAIPTANPIAPLPLASMSSQVNATNDAYDGYVYNNNLYLAFNGSDGGGAIRVLYLSSTLNQFSPFIITGTSAELISVTANQGTGSAAIWVTYWNSSSTNGFTTSFTPALVQTLTPTQVITAQNISELTAIAVNNVLTILYEVINTYTYNAQRTDYVEYVTVTATGTVSSITLLKRSVGIASKPFYLSSTNRIYDLLVYGGPLQPTYFLLQLDGTIVAKLAYSNAGGYAFDQVLPSVTVTNNTVQFSYLFADQLVAVNKTQGVENIDGIFAQKGVNLATLVVQDNPLITAEIGNNLHFNGGQLLSYDGVKPVEQNFNVWPENIQSTGSATGGGLSPQIYFYQFTYEWTDAQGNLFRSAPSVPYELDLSKINQTTTSATFTDNQPTITVASASGIVVGATVIDTTTPSNIAGGTTVTEINGTTISLSNNTLGTAGPDTLVFSGTPITFTGTFTSGSTTIAASSVTGLVVGQVLIDNTNPTFIQTNTHITAINGTTLTIDLPTLGAGSGDTLATFDTLSATVNVPTLRLTAKTGINPVKIVGYRWSAGQQVYYQFTPVLTPYINDVTIDSISISDTNSDFAILGNEIIYTTGGVIEDIGPPATSTMTLYKSRLFLVDAEDRNLLWFSKQVIESTPVEMSDLLTLYLAPTIGSQGSTGPITALAAMDDKLIVFKENAIYYMTGDGPNNTGSNSDFSDFIFIAGTVGCTNQQSIVFTPNGLMFQSDKGIWLLDRDLGTTYIGAPVEAYNQDLVVAALAIPDTNQVRFTLNNGITLLYDYYYQQWGTFDGVPAISSTLYQDLHTYINALGEVFQETPGLYLDGSLPVLMSFTTAWLNLAGIQGYERAYQFYMLGNFISPHMLSVQIAYDYNPSNTQQSIITPDNYSGPYGTGIYGSVTPYGGPPSVEQWRIFLERQKCQAFQITINEIFDPSYGTIAGAGLVMSGLNIILGTKNGSYPRLKPSRSVG